MALFKMKGFPKQTVTGKQIQQLDDMIARAKKLGKDGTAQVLIDKKSKLEDKMQKEAEIAAAQARQIKDDPGNKYDPSKDKE
jgi:pyridoxal/pyridoxine/pyridoxamine kinase